MEFVPPPSPFHRVSLKLAIFNEQQDLLVAQTDDGTWELPGGGWEHGEEPLECLNRELEEELGVQLASVDFTPICFYRATNKRGYQALKIVLKGQLASDDFTPGDGMVAARYVSAAELQTLPMQPDEAGIKDHIDQVWSRAA